MTGNSPQEKQTSSASTGSVASSSHKNGQLVCCETARQKIHHSASLWHSPKHNGKLALSCNTTGKRHPLFWVMSNRCDAEQMMANIHRNQPLHILPALREVDLTPQQTALVYLEEILRIQPEGPYVLGGFMTGGEIAFHIADNLRKRGLDVPLLALQECFVPQFYGGRVAMIMCERSAFSPWSHFTMPQYGWLKFYRNNICHYLSKARLRNYYTDAHYISEFIQQLNLEMTYALEGIKSPKFISRKKLQLLEEGDHKALIQYSVPPFLEPGEKITLPVLIKNCSATTWLPTRSSGITLCNRWFRGKRLKIRKDGCTNLTQPLGPGEQVILQLDITAPSKIKPWRLDIDLVDQGLSFFQEENGNSQHIPVVIFKGARVFRPFYRSRFETEPLENEDKDNLE